METIYGKLDELDETKDKCKEESEIQKFYAGKTIFLTGATGYLGKSIVEKLLRSCPDLKRLYLLIRPKREKSVDKRLEKYFQDILFDTLRKRTPNFYKKVVPISGNLSMEGMGLFAENRDTIIQETDIFIHNAAVVKFNEKASYMLTVNVLGTKQLLELSLECKRLKLFVYVSTAYSNCYELEIKEELCPPPADLKYVQDIIDADTKSNGISDECLKAALGKWPNLYTFTKSLTENIVEEYSRKATFSCCVYRPSIIISSYREPIIGWCDNLNGPVAGLVGYALGIIHVIWALNNVLDYVPVDMCTNSLLATAWDVTVNRKNNRETVVYNYGSGTTNPMTVRSTFYLLKKVIKKRPLKKMVWLPFIFITERYWLWVCLDKLGHFVPAVVVDCLRLILRKKPLAVPTYMRITKYINLIYYFGNRDWRIHITKMEKMWDRMNSVDRELFFCDIRKIEWESFDLGYWSGIRVHTMKDSMDTLEEAKRKYRKLHMIHYTVLFILILLIFYFLTGVVRIF